MKEERRINVSLLLSADKCQFTVVRRQIVLVQDITVRSYFYKC